MQKEKKEGKQIVCDNCGSFFNSNEAVEGEDFGYYYCSESCKKSEEVIPSQPKEGGEGE